MNEHKRKKTCRIDEIFWPMDSIESVEIAILIYLALSMKCKLYMFYATHITIHEQSRNVQRNTAHTRSMDG